MKRFYDKYRASDENTVPHWLCDTCVNMNCKTRGTRQVFQNSCGFYISKEDKRYFDQQNNYNWQRRMSVKLLPFFPATKDELVKKTGYSINTIEKLLGYLISDKKVWGVSMPRTKTIYEMRTK